MTIHAREIILIGAAFAEDLVLAEERTTEKDRKRTMEGKLIGLWQHCAAVAFRGGVWPDLRGLAYKGQKRIAYALLSLGTNMEKIGHASKILHVIR